MFCVCLAWQPLPLGQSLPSGTGPRRSLPHRESGIVCREPLACRNHVIASAHFPTPAVHPSRKKRTTPTFKRKRVVLLFLHGRNRRSRFLTRGFFTHRGNSAPAFSGEQIRFPVTPVKFPFPILDGLVLLLPVGSYSLLPVGFHSCFKWGRFPASDGVILSASDGTAPPVLLLGKFPSTLGGMVLLLG